MGFEKFTPVALKDSALFTPVKVGPVEVQQRVVLCPLTRLRNQNYQPTDLNVTYYDQRTKAPGTLIITEATGISFKYGSVGWVAPAIGLDEEVEAWKKVHKAIHANGSFSFQQLWAMGRQGDPTLLAQSGRNYYSASDDVYETEEIKTTALNLGLKLQGLTLDEIKEVVADFVTAAKNALKAGADGVEIHGANGYLPLQFLDPISNKRTDQYGGSIENRARFVLEIVDAVVAAVGAEKVGIRLSPFATYGGQTGYTDPTSFVHHAYVISELERRARAGNRLAYIHIVEPLRNEAPIYDSNGKELDQSNHSNDFIYTIWNGAVIRAGDYALNPELAKQHAAVGSTLIGYGRAFIANPDLPLRLKDGLPLNEYNRDLFYTQEAAGYIDYPTYAETQASTTTEAQK